MPRLLSRMMALAFVALLAGIAHSALVEIKLPQRSAGPPPQVLSAKPAPSEAPPAPHDPASPANPAPGTTSTPPNAPAAQPISPTAALGLEIHLSDAFALFQQAKPFFDARHLKEFEAGHVQDAALAPTDEFSERIGELMAYKDETVVIYCGGGQCDASHNLAIKLEQAGFKSLHIMVDGYPAWEKAGYPTAKGAPNGKGG